MGDGIQVDTRLYAPSFMAAYCGIDHYLVVANVRERVAAPKPMKIFTLTGSVSRKY
jgi:hypothetical protein